MELAESVWHGCRPAAEHDQRDAEKNYIPISQLRGWIISLVHFWVIYVITVNRKLCTYIIYKVSECRLPWKSNRVVEGNRYLQQPLSKLILVCPLTGLVYTYVVPQHGAEK